MVRVYVTAKDDVVSFKTRLIDTRTRSGVRVLALSIECSSNQNSFKSAPECCHVITLFDGLCEPVPCTVNESPITRRPQIRPAISQPTSAL